MSKKKLNPQPGNVYAVQLPNTKWGALVVLREIENSYLVYTTSYFDETYPSINDSNLANIYFRMDMYTQKLEPEIYWLDGKPGKDFELIGNIDLADKQEIQESRRYRGVWKNYWPIQLVYDEERKMEESNDIQSDKDVNTKSVQNPIPTVNMLEDNVFWRLISFLKLQEEDSTKNLIEHLSLSSIETIYAFEEALAYKLYLLDTPLHAGFQNFNNEYFSVDSFLYARCAVVAKGKLYFKDVLDNPTSMDLEDDFEELLMVSSEAFSKKTGKPFEYVSTHNYETFSNKKAWDIN